MKTKLSWIFIIAIGVMFICALAFDPAHVRAEGSAQSAGGELGLVDDVAEAEDLETQTFLTTDLVKPCRIVDTRVAGPGFFPPSQARDYYVYGPNLDIFPQGGNFSGCPAPRGEPKGVILNVTAIPVGGSGNFRLYPPNVSAPSVSFINYRAGVQNIANGGTFETYFSVGPREIRVLNSFGFAHLVIDVMGYLDN